MFEDIKIKLGAPNYPYDTMTFSGEVDERSDDGSVTVSFVGENSLGSHVRGRRRYGFPLSFAPLEVVAVVCFHRSCSAGV